MRALHEHLVDARVHRDESTIVEDGPCLDLTDDAEVIDLTGRRRLVVPEISSALRPGGGFGPYLKLRYGIERIAATVGLVVLSPVIALVALVIRLGAGRGVIYRQRRVGHQGRVFTIYKFRTMDPDRRSQTVAVIEDRRCVHKTADDPRHTRLGSLLRRTSLDELPQLLNVAKGEMSLIGPRPELESVVAERDLWRHPRHLLRPGITGQWQVSEDRAELLHENLHHDVEYVRTVSPRADLRIIGRTLSAVVRGTGA